MEREKTMTKKPNGVVIYRGPSMLDGAPIIAIATGLENGSNNGKTGGGLIQTWIIREDVSPTDAVNSGDDGSVCGSGEHGCRHRGKIVDGKNVGRSCYVTVFQAPLNVYKSYHRGIYPMVPEAELADIFADRMVRLGAYGDPAAVPFHVWQNVLAKAKAKTGYSHQWRVLAFQGLREYCMASCDTAEEREEARALGWRTFRVRAAGEALGEREIACPASKESGHKTTCDRCIGCGGTSAKAKVDFVIIAHGSAAKVNAFNRPSSI
jgi:hypothetical protein